MLDHVALRRAFAEYASTLVRPYDVGDVLYRLTDQVVEVLGVAGAGVSIASDGESLRFVTASNDRVVRVEETQVAASEGPCHLAHATGRRVVVPDLDLETRWPRYVETARDNGFRGVVGLPMALGEQPVGALNVYDVEVGWEDEELETAQLLADMAVGYIMNAQELSRSRELADQLRHALDSRVVVEQAKGILAERWHTDVGHAFSVLRRQARSRGVKLHHLAAAVVNGDVDLDPPEQG